MCRCQVLRKVFVSSLSNFERLEHVLFREKKQPIVGRKHIGVGLWMLAEQHSLVGLQALGLEPYERQWHVLGRLSWWLRHQRHAVVWPHIRQRRGVIRALAYLLALLLVSFDKFL